ncbi:MAG: DUF1653 domain-containing protein [Bacteroidales bacterium]|nr:DUF1653 domain-containing protein [Bacteroidales bacterium]
MRKFENLSVSLTMEQYYRHFRNRKIYRFVAFATIEATEEEAVVYQAMVRRQALLLLFLFSFLVANGQEPAPPTQKWCEWAFRQIPDRKNLEEVDSTAFSSDFYCLLKELDRLATWQYETCDCKPPGADCLLYWYSDMEGSRLDGDRAKLSFEFLPKTPLAGVVMVTMDHPDYLNYDGTHVTKYPMSIVYENGDWRIIDWDSKWSEIADDFGLYQKYESGNIEINPRALAIISGYLEQHQY